MSRCGPGNGRLDLAPEVFQRSFGNQPSYPALMVLDSIHPAAVKRCIDLDRHCFISSKSGTTTETNSFFIILGEIKQLKPEPGEHFAAITDPGTPLEKIAGERKFRAVFTAPEDIGGRYSH